MLHYLPGSEHKIGHAYKVSGWGCRISRVRQTRSYMPTRYQDEAAGSHGFGTTVPTCIRGIRTGLQDMSGRGCRISQVGNWRSYILTVLGRGCRISRVRQTRSVQTCIRGITTELQDLMGKKHQIEHAYEVSGWGCRLSRVKNNSSNMQTRYPDGAAGPHGWGTSDRTCLQCVRVGLQDFTGWELQIVHTNQASGGDFKISRVRNTRSNVPIRCQDGVA